MKAALISAVAMLALLLAPPLQADDFETTNVVLYQPDEVMSARVSNVSDLAAYIQKLQAVCTQFFASTKTPETLHIVVAVRPDGRSRVWLVSSTRPASDPERKPLLDKLEAVPPLAVKRGPIAFAISATLAGGDAKNSNRGGDFKPPIPKEWQDAAKGKEGLVIPDGFLHLVWPDKP